MGVGRVVEHRDLNPGSLSIGTCSGEVKEALNVRSGTRIATIAIGLAGGLAAALIAARAVQPSTPEFAGILDVRPSPAPGNPASGQPPSVPGNDKATPLPASPGAGPAARSASPASPASPAFPGSSASSAGSAGGSGSGQPGPAPSTSAPKPAPTPTTSSPSYYVITNKAHGYCLNAMSTANTAQVDVYGCNSSWYQDWTGIKAGSAEEIVNKESGLCLSARSFAKGADVIIETCEKTDNQLWLPDGSMLRLDTTSSGVCLGADSSGTNESPAGAPACASSTVQEWTW